MDQRVEQTDASRPPSGTKWAVYAALVAVFVVAFWHTFAGLWRVWQTDLDYGAGQLVPIAAAYMLWTGRQALPHQGVTFNFGGMAVFFLGLALNIFGVYYLYSSLQNIGLVVAANGLAVTLLGWEGYKRVWHPFVFLILMAPLPKRAHDMVMLPLQTAGAWVSAGVLEILGVPTERRGNVLEVGSYQVAVAEACNGLRMAVAFLIVACVVAFIVNRPRWQKVTIVLSSVPIALVCNVVRIVFTACLYSAGYERLAQGVLHDAAGLLMMPLALILIFVELGILSKLVRPAGDGEDYRAVANEART